MALPLYEVRNLQIGFANEVILENVNFDVYENEIFVLIGPSGAGKTLLLKNLAGLMKPRSGSLTRTAMNQKVGMLFQKNALFDYLSVEENVAFPLREATDCDPEKIRGNVEKYLDFVGIRHAKELFPDQISGGMQKRLGIARALALEPDILLLDDPTAGLDPVTSRKIVELIKSIKQKSKKMSVISVCSDVRQAMALADRLALVIKKTVIVTGTKDQTLNHERDFVRQFILGDLQGPLSELA